MMVKKGRLPKIPAWLEGWSGLLQARSGDLYGLSSVRNFFQSRDRT